MTLAALVFVELVSFTLAGDEFNEFIERSVPASLSLDVFDSLAAVESAGVESVFVSP